MPKIRVLLADDHPAMSARVRRELGNEFEIVASVANGEEAIKAVAQFDPDILVIDISMPVLNGLEAAARLRSAHSRTKIIFLTIHGDPDFVAAAFSAGASAYVMKNHLSSDLVAAIREALQGHTFISHSASGRG